MEKFPSLKFFLHSRGDWRDWQLSGMPVFAANLEDDTRVLLISPLTGGLVASNGSLDSPQISLFLLVLGTELSSWGHKWSCSSEVEVSSACAPLLQPARLPAPPYFPQNHKCIPFSSLHFFPLMYFPFVFLHLHIFPSLDPRSWHLENLLLIPLFLFTVLLLYLHWFPSFDKLNIQELEIFQAKPDKFHIQQKKNK